MTVEEQATVRGPVGKLVRLAGALIAVVLLLVVVRALVGLAVLHLPTIVLSVYAIGALIQGAIQLVVIVQILTSRPLDGDHKKNPWFESRAAEEFNNTTLTRRTRSWIQKALALAESSTLWPVFSVSQICHSVRYKARHPSAPPLSPASAAANVTLHYSGHLERLGILLVLLGACGLGWTRPDALDPMRIVVFSVLAGLTASIVRVTVQVDSVTKEIRRSIGSPLPKFVVYLVGAIASYVIGFLYLRYPSLHDALRWDSVRSVVLDIALASTLRSLVEARNPLELGSIGLFSSVCGATVYYLLLRSIRRFGLGEFSQGPEDWKVIATAHHHLGEFSKGLAAATRLEHSPDRWVCELVGLLGVNRIPEALKVGEKLLDGLVLPDARFVVGVTFGWFKFPRHIYLNFLSEALARPCHELDVLFLVAARDATDESLLEEALGVLDARSVDAPAARAFLLVLLGRHDEASTVLEGATGTAGASSLAPTRAILTLVASITPTSPAAEDRRVVETWAEEWLPKLRMMPKVGDEPHHVAQLSSLLVLVRSIALRNCPHRREEFDDTVEAFIANGNRVLPATPVWTPQVFRFALTHFSAT